MPKRGFWRRCRRCSRWPEGRCPMCASRALGLTIRPLLVATSTLPGSLRCTRRGSSGVCTSLWTWLPHYAKRSPMGGGWSNSWQNTESRWSMSIGVAAGERSAHGGRGVKKAVPRLPGGQHLPGCLRPSPRSSRAPCSKRPIITRPQVRDHSRRGFSLLKFCHKGG